MHQAGNVLQPKLLTRQNLSSDQLASEFSVVYLHSITSEKGRDLLHKYLNEIKANKN